MNWVSLFEAYKILNVSLATLIYYVGPVIVLLFSPILFRERLTMRKILSVIVVGGGLICISGSIVVEGTNSLGLIVALISYLDPVSALLFSALLLHEAMTPVQLAGAVMIIGGALFGEIKNQKS